MQAATENAACTMQKSCIANYMRRLTRWASLRYLNAKRRTKESRKNAKKPNALSDAPNYSQAMISTTTPRLIAICDFLSNKQELIIMQTKNSL